MKAAGPLQGKVLIDCTNPYHEDLTGLAIGQTSSAAEEIAKHGCPGGKGGEGFQYGILADIYHSESRLFGLTSIWQQCFTAVMTKTQKKTVVRA